MLTHSQIWAAIDALAVREGLSPSRLAKHAGLDATTFNRSKRQNAKGQLRWPSTESIAKVLTATGADIDEFLHLIPKGARLSRRVPLRVLDETILPEAVAGWFDGDGNPGPDGWEEIAFPAVSEQALFALEVRSDRYAPLYRNGDILIVAQDAPPRRGDRVFVLETSGHISLEVLGHQTATHLHFMTLNGKPASARSLETIRMVFRIVWASQ